METVVEILAFALNITIAMFFSLSMVAVLYGIRNPLAVTGAVLGSVVIVNGLLGL